jgi:23S rRNA (cytosine1962-C5)-methyltransferase
MTPAKIILKPGRARPFWHGHPWVFSEGIARQEGSLAAGDQVLLCDDKGVELGRGLYNPDSQIRVRLLSKPGVDLEAPSFWKAKLQEAISLRRRLGLPNQETTAYRLINSEGDGLSGLTVDVLGEVFSVQCTSIGISRRAAMLFDLLQGLLSPRAIIEMSSPHQELEGFSMIPGVRRGELPGEEWPIKENGVWYSVSPLSSQKTGFYCDQRENRARVAQLCQGKKILDAYCFSGGFALNALSRGASAATLVDASAKALALAAKNIAANQFQAALIEQDALYFLERCTESFGVVILDPPKFAKRAKDKINALSGYKKLNAAGLRLVEPGGFLVTCSCSGLITEDELVRAISDAAYEAKRVVSLTSISGAGPDHPIRLPCIEGRYLKCIIARVL